MTFPASRIGRIVANNKKPTSAASTRIKTGSSKAVNRADAVGHLCIIVIGESKKHLVQLARFLADRKDPYRQRRKRTALLERVGYLLARGDPLTALLKGLLEDDVARPIAPPIPPLGSIRRRCGSACR